MRPNFVGADRLIVCDVAVLGILIDFAINVVNVIHIGFAVAPFIL